MYLRLFLLAITLLCLFISCEQLGRKAVEKVQTLDLTSQREDNPKLFNDYFKYVHSIPLETNDSCLIRFISKIQFYKETIYILDALEKSVFAFDRQGQFLRSYKHQGQGPEEYTSLTDFFVKNDTLFLLDGRQGRLLQYTLEDTFIAVDAIERTDAIYLWDKGRYASHRGFGFAVRNNEQFHSYAFYKNGEMMEESVPFNKHLLGHRFTHGFGSNQFYTYNDSVYALFSFNDTIYAVDAQSGKLSPYLAIKTSGKRIRLDDGKAEVEKLSETSSSIFGFYKWRLYQMFTYTQGNEWINVLAHHNEILFHGKWGRDENHLPVHVVCYDTDRGHELLLSVIQPSEINFQKCPVAKDWANTVTVESNPILVFYQPKF